ncbi:SDR family NAD(P)-dependent oxidoreductase [Paenibacillus radicis (ex Xue et al. 2023)]|uniref:SDR family oxidoreductase n=1 Tax=Paenibacillus radicis (ex Xue et al. 2023) TaxID=2972489 RepID=A0ABT1YEG5_9BACL|nr:glucose 1-dehydrogenase [Paenibacillus radicis (ex Xue et al. 2023)]MCR8631145.1 SDR family oxidoreductase [Paenibacillus radicis (ex Xue et al. 2023)]
MQKVVAVTGGAQGIGKAVALAYVKAGYVVAIADADQEAGMETTRELLHTGGQAVFMCVNVAREDEVTRWIQSIQREFGRIDVLINNAGISRNGSMLQLSVDQFDEVIGVNLRGAFLCSQQAAAVMKLQGSGAIVNMASTRALMSEADTEAYSASKGGLVALTHAMAVSLGRYGIRVNAISPGWIETRDWQKSTNRQEPVHSERDKLQHPVGRVGTPEDIAAACLYLTGDQAGFITGQNLIIDGGMTVNMIYE